MSGPTWALEACPCLRLSDRPPVCSCCPPPPLSWGLEGGEVCPVVPPPDPEGGDTQPGAGLLWPAGRGPRQRKGGGLGGGLTSFTTQSRQSPPLPAAPVGAEAWNLTFI